MNDTKQALLDRITQTYILIEEEQENDKNITNINSKINDVLNQMKPLRNFLRRDKLKLSDAKNKSGEFEEITIPELKKDQSVPDDKIIYDVGITELEKQERIEESEKQQKLRENQVKLEQSQHMLEQSQEGLKKLKRTKFKSKDKWKWWVYVVLFLVPFSLWEYTFRKIVDYEIQKPQLDEKEVATFKFLVSRTADNIALVAGLILGVVFVIALRLIIVWHKNRPTYNRKIDACNRKISEYSQKVAEYSRKVAECSQEISKYNKYKENSAVRNQLIRETGKKVIAEQRRNKYEAQVARRDKMIRKNEWHRSRANKAIRELPIVIEQNENQLKNYDHIKRQYNDYLKQAQEFGELLKSKEDLFIDVPFRRFGNFDYYADLYEIVRTEQALTVGDAVRIVEDRWERAEQNLALLQEIRHNGVLMRNTVERGLQNISGELETIIDQQKMIQTGVEETNNQLVKVSHGINILDTSVKSGTHAITSSINSSARNINSTIRSGIAANIAANTAGQAYTNSQLEETNRKLEEMNKELNNVNWSVNNTNSQLSKKLPNK